MQYCTRCVYPAASAMPLAFDENGVCSGCRVDDQKENIDWQARRDMMRELVAKYRNPDHYDIIIPVSGGKDSYFQAHVATELLGLRPLLVTYHANNFTPEGEYNLQRMRELFRCDHHIVRPGADMLIKMNRLGFRLQGDMNWHSHCGIFTVPIQAAVRWEVPLVLWGEHGFMDLAGMYAYDDFVEFTAKFRLEHAMRGYDWPDFTDEGLENLARPELKEGLESRDLNCFKYPDDDDLDDVGVRGIYTSNFFPWDSNGHLPLVMEKYGWRPSATPFERTYRNFSSLDDMHDVGVHDYLKFIKLGYGRASDHACHDIRAGRMTREQGIAMVRRYDHVKPVRDLARWLEYVGMSEAEFDHTCDTFRDPRVWRIEGGEWVKRCVWGGEEVFGPVHLAGPEIQSFKTRRAEIEAGVAARRTDLAPAGSRKGTA
ncbi:MAG: N-acetyl sugar amidotransferase [bacterium]